MKNKETALILINSLREEVRKRHTALKKIDDEEMEILRRLSCHQNDSFVREFLQPAAVMVAGPLIFPQLTKAYNRTT